MDWTIKREMLKGVMTQLMVGTLSGLCSPFLKGGNSAFIAAIGSGFPPPPQNDFGGLNNYGSNGPNRNKMGSNY